MSETPRKKEVENMLMINLQQTDSSSREDLSDTGSSPLRRSRAEADRKASKKDLKEKKRKTKLEKYVAKAVFEIQTDFDYEDLISVTYKKILRVFMRLTGSEFGYIAEVKPQNKEPEFLQSSFNNVLFRCVIDGSENLDLRQEEQYNPIASLLTDPKNISGAAIHSKEILLSNGDLDPSAATPSVNERQYSIPELQILGRASLKNFVGIPLLQRKKRNQESTIIGIIGIGNKLNGFTMEFIKALKPFLTTCETLIQAYNNYRIVNKQFADAEQLQSLTLLIRNPETGFVLKDRKYHLKTYKNCFIGKESVTWILENCEYLGVKTREDALKLGQQLMDMKVFQHVTRDHPFEDEAQYYIFTDEPPEEDRPTTPENKVRVRSSSFVFNLLGTPPVASPAVNQDRLELHGMVMKRDAYSLRKKLSKKRAIEQLNQVNSDNKTALHIAIENNDYECVELLLKAYRQHIDKADIHIKDRNGYTPLHTASELANEKIIMALLLHPGIQTNIGNNYMNTPFHCFCNKFSSPSSISQLFDLWMQRGTLINSVNKGGETPLHKAILNPTMRAIVARRLVEYGADVNIQNSLNGETPLHYAIHLYRKDLVYILLCGGADPDIRSELVNAELEENQEIAALAWLDKIQMRNYLPVFIKHLIFLDVLPSVNEKTLIDMEITLAGDRLRILQAIDEYKNELNKRNSNEIVPKNKIRLADLRRKTALHTENPVIIPLPSTPTSASNAENLLMKHLNSKEVNWIKYSDIEFTELLGTGTSGAVYRGFFKGEEVAIKVLEKDKDNKIDEFIHEFKIMNAITGPNIVQFYGACIDPKPVLVMEFCSRGNLYELLSDQQVIFGWKEVLRFSTEMTRALDVLHSHQPPVLHRDLKSPNLLVTKGWSIKMCDFGLSRFSTATMNTFYQLRGTMAYCAPETFEGKLYTDSSDVYSLGIIMWEMLYKCVTGEYQRPYAEYTYITQPFQIIIQAAQRGLRPTIPIADKCPQPFVSLINACWDSDNSRRPTTKQILQALDLCKKDFDEKRDEWNACICHPHVSTATIKEHLGGSDDNN